MFLVVVARSPLPSVVLHISFLEIEHSYQMYMELYGLKVVFADDRSSLLFAFVLFSHYRFTH